MATWTGDLGYLLTTYGSPVVYIAVMHGLLCVCKPSADPLLRINSLVIFNIEGNHDILGLVKF
jgi:hypothetical protein